MAMSQKRPKRKLSGGRYRDDEKKKLRYLGRTPTLTGLGLLKTKSIRKTGGSYKKITLTSDIANVYDPKEKKHYKLKIETIVDNPANRNFVRRNIMTKGAVIKTEKGNAKITSRPGQEGRINATLL